MHSNIEEFHISIPTQISTLYVIGHIFNIDGVP